MTAGLPTAHPAPPAAVARPPRAVRRAAAWPLLGFGGVLVAAATAEVSGDAARWFGLRGPHCPLGTLVDPAACPGCGLVRSVAAAVQGDLALAVARHPAGPLLAALAVVGFSLAAAVLVRGRAPSWMAGAVRWGARLAVAGVAAGWAWRLSTCLA